MHLPYKILIAIRHFLQPQRYFGNIFVGCDSFKTCEVWTIIVVQVNTENQLKIRPNAMIADNATKAN